MRPENLDPRIITDLNLDPVAEIAPVRPEILPKPVSGNPESNFDLIDELLTANQEDPNLEESRKKATDDSPYY